MFIPMWLVVICFDYFKAPESKYLRFTRKLVPALLILVTVTHANEFVVASRVVLSNQLSETLREAWYERDTYTSLVSCQEDLSRQNKIFQEAKNKLSSRTAEGESVSMTYPKCFNREALEDSVQAARLRNFSH